MPISELVPYAQIGGTVAAALGLFVTAWQFSRTRRTTTMQQLQDFLKSTNERELALAAAKDQQGFRHAFIEFLNFLETYAAALNGDLLFGTAREIVRDKLIDSLTVLEGSPHWHEGIEKSISTSVTYKHLLRFIEMNRRAIQLRRPKAV